MFEDEEDAGDEYMFKRKPGVKIYNSKNQKANIELIHDNRLFQIVKVSIQWKLPLRKYSDWNKQNNRMMTFNIENYITLQWDSRRIDIKT